MYEPHAGQRALVCGADGFVGGHLVERLKLEGFWVRAVGLRRAERQAGADEFLCLDLRQVAACRQAVAGPQIDQVYQLAADMGGMEYIHSAECDTLGNNVRINVNMIEAAAQARVGRYLFASSVCVYRMAVGEAPLSEADAYPAMPANEYGWEKLYSERVVQAYRRHFPLNVRIGRFENTYGPFNPWQGGREKAPAALCRKIARVQPGGQIEAFGDGTAVRAYTFIDDLVDGIRLLMDSDCDEPANIGTSEYVTLAELIATIGHISGKQFEVVYVPGPVGVRSRNFSKNRIESMGYKPKYSLAQGIQITYDWILQQVRSAPVLSSGD